MSDGLPTEEQLRRIQRGVQRRIDRRREVVRGITSAAVVVALLSGGVALLRPVGGASSGTTGAAAGSAASQAADGSMALVRCHTTSDRASATEVARVPQGTAAAEVAAACGATAVEFQSGSGRLPAPAATGAASRSPSPSSPSPAPSSATPSAVVCVAADGVLHVFPADDRPVTLCARNGMRPD